jgi:hypothetical protein
MRGLRHPHGVVGRLQRILLGLHLELRDAAAAGHGEQARILVGLLFGRVAGAHGVVVVGAGFLLLGRLALRQLAGALGQAALVLALFHRHRFLQCRGAALQHRFLFREFLPFALGVLELQARFQGVAGRLDGAARVQAGDDVALVHRLALGDVDIAQLAIDGRVQAPHLGRRHQRAAGRHQHVGMAEEGPDQRRGDQRHHRPYQRLRIAPGVGGEDRDAFGAVVFQRLRQRRERRCFHGCPLASASARASLSASA